MAHKKVIAQCPYYIHEHRRAVFCESSIQLEADGAEGEEGQMGCFSMLFRDEKAKEKYMKKHCGKLRDTDCIYAEFLEIKSRRKP